MASISNSNHKSRYKDLYIFYIYNLYKDVVHTFNPSTHAAGRSRSSRPTWSTERPGQPGLQRKTKDRKGWREKLRKGGFYQRLLFAFPGKYSLVLHNLNSPQPGMWDIPALQYHLIFQWEITQQAPTSYLTTTEHSLASSAHTIKFSGHLLCTSYARIDDKHFTHLKFLTFHTSL